MADHDEEPSDADRDRILSEKLWAELGLIREYVKDIPAMKEDIAVLRADVTEMKGEQIVHRQILKEHSADITDIKQIVVQHSEDITEMKANITDIKQIVVQHSEDITEMKVDIKEIKSAVVGVQATSHTH